ncbi:hypothetical protein OROMI_002333 [Orobanche minor]
MPAESVSAGRDEVLPAANSSRPCPPPSPPQSQSQSGLNGTNSMEMKTTEKRILLAGAIFYNNSGESFVDENETAHLSGSTRSQSDSSFMSDYSVGESNLSQD